MECHPFVVTEADCGKGLVGKSPFLSRLKGFDFQPQFSIVIVVARTIGIHTDITGGGTAAISVVQGAFESGRRLGGRVRRREFAGGIVRAEDVDLLIRRPPDARSVRLDGRPRVGIVGPGGLECHFLRRVGVLFAGAGPGGRQEQRAENECQLFHIRPSSVNHSTSHRIRCLRCRPARGCRR